MLMGFTMSGGCVASGGMLLPFNTRPECGIVFDGVSIFDTGYILPVTGGIVASGSLNIATGYNLASSLGMVIDGRILPFIIGSLGMVAGGSCAYNWESSWATSGGSVLGGTSIKKQLVFAQSSITQPDFTLTDNSITFKLEVSP
jgi:hypothetical protein